jgi:hypothetical protein
MTKAARRSTSQYMADILIRYVARVRAPDTGRLTRTVTAES